MFAQSEVLGLGYFDIYEAAALWNLRIIRRVFAVVCRRHHFERRIQLEAGSGHRVPIIKIAAATTIIIKLLIVAAFIIKSATTVIVIVFCYWYYYNSYYYCCYFIAIILEH